MSIGVVVVTFNNEKSIQDCVASVLLSPLVSELVIVDNASGDRTLQLIGRGDERIRIVSKSANIGFGRAANEGAAQITSKLIAFVNPDCTVPPETFEKLVGSLGDDNVWAAGPALRNDRGEIEYSARGFPSAWSTLYNRRYLDAFPHSRHRELRRFLMLDATGTVIDCDWLSGALFLIRRVDFQAQHGFDESFFMYYEDVDLFRRRPAGRRVVLLRNAVATHSIGGSSRRIRVRAAVWRVRSAGTYYRKHVRRGLRTDLIFFWATLCGILIEIVSTFRRRS